MQRRFFKDLPRQYEVASLVSHMRHSRLGGDDCTRLRWIHVCRWKVLESDVLSSVRPGRIILSSLREFACCYLP